MIELQREKLMRQQNSQAKPKLNGNPTAAAVPPNPVAQAREEDRQLRVFLQRIQEERDSGHPGETVGTGPTVPTALSRRMLQRQGVGFIDSTVAAVTSASADRFLATVLQQSIACRDSRLKGAAIARNAAKERRRHWKQNQKDADDRRRRREEAEASREEDKLAAIRAMEAIKGTPSPSDTAKRKEAEAENGPRSKKRKKNDSSAVGINGVNPDADDEASRDSLDAEVEEFHNNFDDYDQSEGNSDEDDDDDDDHMILSDMARPLEAWDFHFRGKLDDDPLGLRYQSIDSTGESEETEDPSPQHEIVVIDDIDEDTTNASNGVTLDRKPPPTSVGGSNVHPSNGAAQVAKPPTAP